jgi:hypothetical protein
VQIIEEDDDDDVHRFRPFLFHLNHFFMFSFCFFLFCFFPRQRRAGLDVLSRQGHWEHGVGVKGSEVVVPGRMQTAKERDKDRENRGGVHLDDWTQYSAQLDKERETRALADKAGFRTNLEASAASKAAVNSAIAAIATGPPKPEMVQIVDIRP